MLRIHLMRLLTIASILHLYVGSSFALLPPTEAELEKAMSDPNEYEKVKDQLMVPGGCGFFKNLEEDDEFKEAKRLLREHERALRDLNRSRLFLQDLENDPEISRRKSVLDQAELNLRQKGCDQPETFRTVLRHFDDMDAILKALQENQTHLELYKIREETLPYQEAYEHYHSYRDSLTRSQARVKNTAEVKLNEIEANPLYKKLLKKYNEEELQRIKDTPELETPKQIVINFEGTGQYSPRTVEKMKVLNSYSGIMKSNKDRKKIKDHIWKSHDDKNLGMVTWPGTLHGPISKAVTGLNNKGDEDYKGHPNTQWLYFRSEDQEESRTTAMRCLENYLFRYKKKYKTNFTPKIIVTGHSSGGFSAMKFAEELAQNKPNLNIDLITIDPVIPYEKAALNGLARRMNPFAKNRIGDHSGSDSFKIDSNKMRATNFYQTQDVHGLLPTEDSGNIPIIGDRLKERGVGLGIHGSKIEGADNRLVEFEDGSFDARKGHGSISIDKRVTDFFKTRLSE